ncbi:MAG: PilZ domain-containing protein [Lachnospiraceae bacterium]|nr:PilZ domain-containing protein [Lachnospiraceae bacterium]
MTLEAEVTSEKRKIGRVEFKAPSVVVICDTEETLYVQVEDASPKGMGLWMKDDRPDIEGKDIIIVADTVIMYATVARMVKRDDGTYTVGISAKKFTQEVLEYLFKHIGNPDKD